MITVVNKKRSIENIQKDFPGAYILDITSSSPYHYGQILSPFYPHRNIPIPGDSHGMTATCVEAIWQGLKVFEESDIDKQVFCNDTMKNIKRTTRKYGKPIGHRYGVFSNTILNYADARRLIYIPSYKYILEQIPEVNRIIEKIKDKAKESDIILLDYNINPDNRDISKPISHAELVKMYVENRYPSKEEDFTPFTEEELKAIKQSGKRRSRKKLKIKTPEDKSLAIEKISELLLTAEMSPSDITKLLSIDLDTKELSALLEDIPGIKVRKEKKKKYYTLRELDSIPTLFNQ